MLKPEIFISFRHEEQSLTVRNALMQALEAAGFKVVIDENTVEYGANFRHFMDRLGKGKFIVPIISDGYLKSENCLYEMRRMREKGNLDERVFPIIMPDARKVYNDAASVEYMQYWENRIDQLEVALRGLRSLGFVGDNLSKNEEFIQYRQLVSSMMRWLQEKNTSYLETLTANNFSTLITAIEKQRLAEKDVLEMDWEDMVDGILEGKSVLFLGPEIVSNNGKESGKNATYREIAKQYSQFVINYNEADELFLLRNEAGADFKIRTRAKSYFESRYKPNEDLISRLMEIPFGMYVSMTPDLTLRNAIRQFTDESSYFCVGQASRAGAAETLPAELVPTPGQPLVLNLLGSVEQEESMILTHEDLFGYLRAVLPENVLPPGIREYLSKATGFIFLGFQFDKWYSQLLLRMFSLGQKGNTTVNRHSPTERTGRSTIEWCREDFKVMFLQSGAEEFADELHETIRKRGGNHQLRKRKSS